MTLPDDPSKQGYSPDQIKRRMAAPIIDENESIVSEVNRIVDETNAAIEGLMEFINSEYSGVTDIHVADTPPVNPIKQRVWFDTDFDGFES